MTTTDRDIRAGIIGCGRIAGVHVRHLRTVPGVRIVGVCDLDSERARQVAEQAGGAEVFPGPTELLTQPLDAVHVLTPPTSHADVAIAALERGVHVLVEKPMATTTAAAKRMQEAAIAADRLLCVDHNRLFDPAVIRARQLVESGAIGTLLAVEAHQGVNVQEGGPAAAPLAMWLNLAPHPFYLLRAFVGDITEWQAVGGPMGELRAVCKGTRALGYLCFSPGTQPYLNGLTLHGSDGTLRLDLNTMAVLHARTRRLPSMVQKAALNVDQGLQLLASTARTAAKVAMRRMGTYPGIAEVIRRFHEAVATGGEPPVSAADGLAVVELLERCWARTHEAVAPRRRRITRRAAGETVLVTGASGFLGRRVVAKLAQQGLPVRAMVRFLRDFDDWDDVEQVVATLGDEAALASSLTGVRAVVHCAARVARRGSRDEFFADNVRGTQRLLEAARAAGVERIVHVSSIGIYGTPSDGGPVTEDTPYDAEPDRRGAYTASKVEADQMVLEYGRRTGLRTVAVRPGILVGPGGPEFTARLRVGRVGGRVLIIGRPGARLPLCHVDDVASALVAAVTAPEARGAYNVVDEALTQDEWLRGRVARGWPFRPFYVPPLLAMAPALALEIVARLAGRRPPALSRYRIRRATESVRYDTTRARLDLGWTPETGVAGTGGSSRSVQGPAPARFASAVGEQAS